MNARKMLLRQINIDWIRNDRITSQAFNPMPKHGGFLSTYDGDNISAEDSWRHFTEVENLTSVGVVAITVEECEGSNLPVSHDPTPDNPEHMTIDFNGISGNRARKRAAQKLAALANDRGWLFRAPDIPS